MLFERLADLIAKRAKLIVVIWLFLLLISLPFIMKVGDVIVYNTDEMGGSDSESLKGIEIADEYFYSSEVSTEETVLLVAQFSNETGKNQVGALIAAVESKLGNYLDDEGNPKITLVRVYDSFLDPEDVNTGITIYAVIYNKHMQDESLVGNDTPNLRDLISDAKKDVSGLQLTTYVTGNPAMNYDMEKNAMADVQKIDPFTILLILILVGLFFRSIVASAIPPMAIGAAFGIVMAIMYGLGSYLTIFNFTEIFLLVSMMGAGCDYCIFILARYREERVKGKGHDEALRESITWAGESIFTSGLTVMIGFGAMSICSFSMISSMGVMLAIGIFTALMAALFLITSLLSIFGERLFWPSKFSSFMKGGKATNGIYGKVSKAGHRYFEKSAKFSIRHAKAIVLSAILFTIPMGYVFVNSESSYDMIGAMSAGESVDGMDVMEEYANGGMMMPNYILIELNDSFGSITDAPLPGVPVKLFTWNADQSTDDLLAALDKLRKDLLENDEIGEVATPIDWARLVQAEMIKTPQGASETDLEYATKIFKTICDSLPSTQSKIAISALEELVPLFSTTPDLVEDPVLAGILNYNINVSFGAFVGGDDISETTSMVNFVKIVTISKDEPMSNMAMDSIGVIKDLVTQFENDHSNIVSQTWVTGSAVVMYEISQSVRSEFTKVEILAVALIIILLFFIMKSYFTPIRSVATILMSVVWTVAITSLIFTSLVGMGVIWMIPIILIVICLGLGMDYDILLTMRIRENHLGKGMSNDDAIASAVASSGSVITICGLIMGGAFGTMMLSSTIMLQQFGFALCFAIIVDALIVRTYIVPAAMHLMGEWNWKGPKFLQKRNEH